jgi:hypothetical protein
VLGQARRRQVDGCARSAGALLTSLGLTFTGPGYRAGKTEETTCDRLCDIRLSQYDSVDLRGIPVPHAGMTVWHAPITLPFKGNAAFSEDDVPIFLFLDEINSAAPSVAAVAYQLINDRSVGEHRLMDNVRVVAAGNREQDRGVTNRMPTPLANRFTHVEVDVDVNAWCWWAQEEGLPAEGIAFMQFRKNLLSTFDPAKPDKAFATPRSWEKALLYYADKSMPEHIKQAAMSGAWVRVRRPSSGASSTSGRRSPTWPTSRPTRRVCRCLTRRRSATLWLSQSLAP